MGLPRASFHVEPATGRRWWAFSGTDGRTIIEPETPALAEGLAAVRMGELVIDDKAARDLLDRISGMDQRRSVAREVARLYPLEAARQGLPAAISEWTAQFDRDRAVVDRLKADAQKAIILRTWGSASDQDLAVFGRLEDGAFSLEERAHTVEAAAGTSGTRPPIPPPVTESTLGGISTLGWIGIGAGALALFGVGMAVLSASATPRMAGGPMLGDDRRRGAHKVGDVIWWKGAQVTIRSEPFVLHGGLFQNAVTESGRIVAVATPAQKASDADRSRKAFDEQQAGFRSLGGRVPGEDATFDPASKAVSPWLAHAVRRIKGATSLKALTDEYRKMTAYIDEHGAPGDSRKLWQSYYDRIGRV